MEEDKSSYRWVVLGLLFTSMFIVTIAMNCMPPLFKEIGEQIPLTKTQIGSIMGVMTLASLIFAAIGGGMGDRLGPRMSLGIAIIIMAIGGALRATAGSAFALMMYMFIVGAGIAIFAPNMPKTLGMWFPKSELAMATGISMAGMGVGGAVGMATSASILSPLLGGWRSTLVWIGAVTFAMGILWIIFFKEKASALGPKSKQNVFGNFKKVFAVKDIWLLSIFYGLNMAGLMTIVSLLPINLAERGVTNAGQFVSIMMVASVAFNIAGGVLSDKVGKRKPFLIGSALILGFCIIAFGKVTGAPLIIALVLGGAAMGTIAPVMMVIPVELDDVGPALTATAVGVIFMIGNSGGFIGPVLGGMLMDTYGNFSGFITMGTALILAALVIIPIRETGGKKKSKDDESVSIH